jgi:hypothetical protein
VTVDASIRAKAAQTSSRVIHRGGNPAAALYHCEGDAMDIMWKVRDYVLSLTSKRPVYYTASAGGGCIDWTFRVLYVQFRDSKDPQHLGFRMSLPRFIALVVTTRRRDCEDWRGQLTRWFGEEYASRFTATEAKHFFAWVCGERSSRRIPLTA